MSPRLRLVGVFDGDVQVAADVSAAAAAAAAVAAAAASAVVETAARNSCSRQHEIAEQQ